MGWLRATQAHILTHSPTAVSTRLGTLQRHTSAHPQTRTSPPPSPARPTVDCSHIQTCQRHPDKHAQVHRTPYRVSHANTYMSASLAYTGNPSQAPGPMHTCRTTPGPSTMPAPSAALPGAAHWISSLTAPSLCGPRCDPTPTPTRTPTPTPTRPRRLLSILRTEPSPEPVKLAARASAAAAANSKHREVRRKAAAAEPGAGDARRGREAAG